jgi:hypothetical protein
VAPEVDQTLVGGEWRISARIGSTRASSRLIALFESIGKNYAVCLFIIDLLLNKGSQTLDCLAIDGI